MCVISNRSACNKSCLRVSSKRAKLHWESFMTSIHARRSRCVVPRDGQTSGYDAQAAIPHMLLASLASLKPQGTMPRQRYHTCCWRPWPASNLRVRCPGSDTTHVVGVPGQPQTSGYDAQAAIPHMLLASLASLKPQGTMPRQRYHTCCWRPWRDVCTRSHPTSCPS